MVARIFRNVQRVFDKFSGEKALNVELKKLPEGNGRKEGRDLVQRSVCNFKRTSVNSAASLGKSKFLPS